MPAVWNQEYAAGQDGNDKGPVTDIVPFSGSPCADHSHGSLLSSYSVDWESVRRAPVEKVHTPP
jgi:hypothetical protein